MTEIRPGQKLERFAAESLLSQLEALLKEIDGVLEAKDLEHVHRMRVASRRLRTRLKLFESCLPGKKASEWPREMKRITRALGKARDKDVQIKVVKEFLASASARDQPGLKRLLLRFAQSRIRLQKRVVKAISQFRESGVVQDMEGALRSLRIRGRLLENGSSSAEVHRAAQQAVSAELEEMLSYELYVHQPDRGAELHAMRIAAKYLRYTMETFGPEIPGELQEYIQAAKRIQDLLGELHDSEVWIQALPKFFEKEHARAVEYFGHSKHVSRLKPGMLALEKDRKRKRQEAFKEFGSFWEEIQKQDLWGRLLREMSALIPVPDQPAAGTGAKPLEKETAG